MRLKATLKQAALAALILTEWFCFWDWTAILCISLLRRDKSGVLYVVFLVLIVLVVMLAVYLFAYMARFENSLGQSFKNGADCGGESSVVAASSGASGSERL